MKCYFKSRIQIKSWMSHESCKQQMIKKKREFDVQIMDSIKFIADFPSRVYSVWCHCLQNLNDTDYINAKCHFLCQTTCCQCVFLFFISGWINVFNITEGLASVSIMRWNILNILSAWNTGCDTPCQTIWPHFFCRGSWWPERLEITDRMYSVTLWYITFSVKTNKSHMKQSIKLNSAYISEFTILHTLLSD